MAVGLSKRAFKNKSVDIQKTQLDHKSSASLGHDYSQSSFCSTTSDISPSFRSTELSLKRKGNHKFWHRVHCK